MYEKDVLDLLVITSTFVNSYNEWCIDSELMKILNITKNSLCVRYKYLYPFASDIIIQSIVLAIYCKVYISICMNDKLD